MAGNEWINGYLEAILDAGAKFEQNQGSNSNPNRAAIKKAGAKAGIFSPTRYFVEEVVTSFDESDLHRTWIKVIATRNTRERNNRLENMCWRIWHLARKKKQIEWEDAQGLAKRRLERERGRTDAADDLSELSEGEKEKADANKSEGEKEKGDANKSEAVKDKIHRINSDLQMWSDENKAKRLYIVLISLHGLVRGENMELGRDSDTGGQVKYVVELARSLANTKGVYRVDLLTRQISSPDVDWSYSEPIEMLTHPSSTEAQMCGDSCGAYLIRLPCGPRDKYIPKESLWPHIPEFVDGAMAHIVNMARVLGDQLEWGKPMWPYVIHGHYADAGEAAAHLCGALNVPMVLTGHSLGRNKFEQLMKQGRFSKEDINSTYKIMRRIEGEELGLDGAEMVVTSTRQEIEEQWGLYDGFDLRIERKLRVRRRRGVSCYGRYMPRMAVIPPGMDFSNVTSQESTEWDGDLTSLLSPERNQTRRNLPPIWSEIMRFFTNPHKPMILALSRPDPKKNVTTLLKAFGECRPLRDLANMTLILGNRDDIEEMSSSSAGVLTTVLKLIDKYDLYGQVAYPKHHKQSDVPQIYRLAAKTKGVFINPALVEPFGLTLIEAAAYGLPVVATKNGGPVDIHKALNNGLLVDPHDQKAISDALLKLLAEKTQWQECRKNGLKNIHRFSWPEHCRNYLSHVSNCRNRHPCWRLEKFPAIPEEPLSDSLRDLQDLSIRFSIDSDIKVTGELDAVTQQNQVLDAFRSASAPRQKQITAASGAVYFPGRRLRLFVVAVDCYSADGQVSGKLPAILSAVLGAASRDDRPGRTGIVFSTGSTLAETLEALRSCHVDPIIFDALVCSSGGHVYYPWRDFSGDVEYGSHIEYRWPGENIRSVVTKLATVEGGPEDDVAPDTNASSSHCFSYSVKAGAKVRRIDDIRQRLRMRGFRCNLIYARTCTRLNVVPLFASRRQALRYLSIRWGIDLSKVVVFVGDKGDTDYESLLPGLHRTLILNSTVENGSERLLRSDESYKREDAVPIPSSNIGFVDESPHTQEIISNALESIGMR